MKNVIGLLLLGLLGASCATAPETEPLDEQMVSDAYVYLLGRALVVRQEQTDSAAQLARRKPLRSGPRQ